jgi:hypothetical protein
MGKASSSKKVARAARAGGRTTAGPKRHVGFPIAIAVVVVVGVLGVLFARGDNQEAAAVSAAAGENATLAKWGETVGLEFSSTGFTVDGTTYEDGYDCNGQPATVSLHVWSADDLQAEPTIVPVSEIGGFRFDQNRLAITLAVVPAGTEVPPPTTTGDLDNIDPVTDEVISESTTTTALAGATDPTDTTVAADPSASSTSTASTVAP